MPRCRRSSSWIRVSSQGASAPRITMEGSGHSITVSTRPGGIPLERRTVDSALHLYADNYELAANVERVRRQFHGEKGSPGRGLVGAVQGNEEYSSYCRRTPVDDLRELGKNVPAKHLGFRDVRVQEFSLECEVREVPREDCAHLPPEAERYVIGVVLQTTQPLDERHRPHLPAAPCGAWRWGVARKRLPKPRPFPGRGVSTPSRTTSGQLPYR